MIPCVMTGYIISCDIKIPDTDQPVKSPIIGSVSNLPPITTPFVYAVPAEQSLWPSYDGTYLYDKVVGPISRQESGTLLLDVRKDYGGSIQIYDKVTKQHLINFVDLGRESGMSSYGGPLSFADDSPRWKGIGYNPLQAGDDGLNASPILFHGYINGWIYTKAQCLSWAHKDARKLPFFYEQWVRLDENKVHVKVRLTHQRPDKTFYGPESQEWPMMFINGNRKIHFYNGDSPYTNDLATITDGLESTTTTGSSTQYVVQQQTPFGLTEPWQAIEIGANRLIGLYTPGFYWGTYSVYAVAANSNWEGDATATYVTNAPFIHLDSDNIWYREYSYIIGTEQEIRNHVYAQERFPTPDFFFNKFNGRSGWYIQDGGYDQKEPFTTDNWQVTLTGQPENGSFNAYNTKLVSPAGNWKATDFKTLYIRMAYSGPSGTGTGAQAPLRLSWLINGQAPDGIDDTFPKQNKIRFPNGTRKRGDQSISFNVVNDGQFHTYKISFANQPKWTGVIQRFELAHELAPDYIRPGEVITLNYVGTRNPDPGQ